MNFIKKHAKKISIGALSILGLAGASASFASTPSATSTLDTLAGTIINTSVSLATTVLTTYWPYILVFAVLAALIAVFTKFVHLGSKHK